MLQTSTQIPGTPRPETVEKPWPRNPDYCLAFHFNHWEGYSTIKKSNMRSGSDELLLKHQAAIIESILDSKAKYRKVVQAGIAKWISDFQKGLIEIKSVDDLKKLIELDIELQSDEF